MESPLTNKECRFLYVPLIYAAVKGAVRIGNRLFHLRFKNFQFGIRGNGRLTYSFLCVQAGEGEGSYAQLCSIFLCIGVGNDLPRYVQPKHPLI